MRRQPVDVLLYAEDPGAANFIAPLPDTLAVRGIRSLLLAEGAAAEWFERAAVASTRPNATADDMLDTHAPRLLIVGTSENKRSLGLALVDAARGRNIPSVGVVDMGMNAAHRFRGESDDPLRHAPDHLVAPDQWTAQAFEKLGLPASSITVCGHPHYDTVRSIGEELNQRDRLAARREFFPDAAEDDLVLVFAAELSDGLDPSEFLRSETYTLTGTSGSDKRTDVVIEELLLALDTVSPRPHMVLRLHPKNTLEEFAPVLGSFNRVSRSEPVLDIVQAADAVVGMTSMLLLEALILGTPTFSIVPRASEREWLPSIRGGATTAVHDRAALTTELPRFLTRARNSHGLAPSCLRFGALERLTACVETWLIDPPRTQTTRTTDPQ